MLLETVHTSHKAFRPSQQALLKLESNEVLQCAGSWVDSDISEERASPRFMMTGACIEYPHEPHRHHDDGGKMFLRNLGIISSSLTV
jgi:hypothetical protein